VDSDAGRLGAVASEHDNVREDYRLPTNREREILEMLLSVELPGIDELRAQVPSARVARWDCGCSSFNIDVDRSVAPVSSVTRSPAVEAVSKPPGDPLDLLLWVEDGWLSGVEIVDYVERHGDESPDEIPPPGDWEPPQARE
jgi:hypothetical protein